MTLKQAIVASAIDSQFSAHPTRGASSTVVAINGITITEVMERAVCSWQDTFCKALFRPLERALVAANYEALALSDSINLDRTC